MPAAVAPRMEEILEARSLFAADGPITFDQFLDWFGPADDVELIDGVAQKRMAAQLDHERLSAFLVGLFVVFADDTGCGEVLGSRTAVRIDPFHGRLPDLLFVRRERLHKLEQKGVRFAPDLVIEITSPGDRLSDVVGLEADYRQIGVPEIVFIDQRRQEVRVTRKHPGDTGDDLEYTDEIIGPGEILRIDCLNGMALPVDWLFVEPRPTVRAALAVLESTSSDT